MSPASGPAPPPPVRLAGSPCPRPPPRRSRRLKVAEIIVETLEKMAPKYPEVNDEVRKRLMAYREQLASE